MAPASIAALSAKVREKDAEKSKILHDIKDLEALKSQKIVGQLLFVVQSVGTISEDYVIDLKVQPSEYNLSVTKLTNLSLGKEIELQLTSKNITIEILCKKSEKEYSTVFDLADVPDNNSLSTHLDGALADGTSLPVHVKATYDTIDGLIESKQLEMKQVEEEIQKIADELKKASTSTVVKSSTKKSKISQTKKKQPKQQQQQQQPQEEVADFDGNDEGEKNASEGIIATITGGIAVGLQTLLNHRAVVLFGVAALAIYTQGELASV